MQGEFRQRLIDGAYPIRGSGIHQPDPAHFIARRQTGRWRGSFETDGQFAINQNWVWGWDALLLSDKYLPAGLQPGLSAYRPGSRTPVGDHRRRLAALSDRRRQPQLFRCALDLLSRLLGARSADADSDHPSGDRLRLHRSTIRSSAASSATRSISPACRAARPTSTPSTSDRRQRSAASPTPPTRRRRSAPELRAARHSGQLQPLLGGIAVAAHHHRLASARCSRRSLRCAPTPRSMHVNNDPNVANFIQTGDSNLVRAMPTVGLEYRYPFISVQSWGTQTIDADRAGHRAPERDRRSAACRTKTRRASIFDASNLFRVDKFSGWDRVEGGGRANYGLQYTAQFNKAGSVNALFGQSYQLFGAELLRARRPDQHRPRQRSRQDRVRLRRARLLSAELARSPSPRASASTSRPSTCKRLELETTRRVRPLERHRCCTATTPRSPRSASSTGGRASSAPRSVKLAANWVRVRRRALRPQCRQVQRRPTSASATSTIASSWP